MREISLALMKLSNFRSSIARSAGFTSCFFVELCEPLRERTEDQKSVGSCGRAGYLGVKIDQTGGCWGYQKVGVGRSIWHRLLGSKGISSSQCQSRPAMHREIVSPVWPASWETGV